MYVGEQKQTKYNEFAKRLISSIDVIDSWAEENKFLGNILNLSEEILLFFAAKTLHEFSQTSLKTNDVSKGATKDCKAHQFFFRKQGTKARLNKQSELFE